MVVVTESSYPSVFRAFQTVEYDNGAINRLESARKEYQVPEKYRLLVVFADGALESMSEEDFQEFCIGEETSARAVASLYPGGAEANKLMNHFFMESWGM